jgi:purine-nucleoside phosphorylase
MTKLSEKLQGRRPKYAIILGSALGDVVEIVNNPLVIPYGDLDGFPVPRISGHAGKIGRASCRERVS